MADALGTPPAAATPTIGVVSDEDHRLAMAGLIAPQTSSLAVRTGVLVAPGSTALITGTSATGTMTVNIAPHHWVTTRGTADGVYLGTKETSTTVNIAAAPGANSRIDVVYAKQNDSSSSISADASTGELYAVATGTAAASPTKPAIPTGAIELGTVTVAAGATSTNGAGVTIANTAQQTGARGARVLCRNQAEEDALTKYASLEIYRIDTGQVKVSNGTTFAVTYDPAFSVSTAPRGRVGSLSASTAGPSAVGGTETMFDAVTFTAAASRRYKVTWDGVWVANTNPVTAQFTIRSAAGASVTAAGTMAHSRNVRSLATGEFLERTFSAEVTGLAAGQVTVGIGVRVALGSGTITIPGTADNLRKTLVEDIGGA